MSKFSDKFKELRKSRNLSQQQLADYLHTSKSSVNMYERGEREPGLEMLEAIADYFNVDMDYLMGKAEIANQALSSVPFPNANEQELLTIYRNVNEDGQDYIMQTARMVEGTERYRRYETVRAASRSVTDKPIEDIKVEKSKIEAALADDSIKTDDDL